MKNNFNKKIVFILYKYLIRNVKIKKIYKKRENIKYNILKNSNENKDNLYEKNKNEQKDINKYISQNISDILIFPLKQKYEENDKKNLKIYLPSNEFRPKQSLGQNYLRDENIIKKIVNSIELDSENCINETTIKNKIKKKTKNEHITSNIIESNVIEKKEKTFESLKNYGNGIIELGCGIGQLTKYLFQKYKNMTGIEIDNKSISILSRNLPNFDYIHDDVLQVNYKQLSLNKKTKLTIIGNLPFYITSQILFCLLDFAIYIEQAIVTVQYEVAKRIIAKANQKDYSILSIILNLYADCHLLFKIPNNAFYPVPKVDSALIKIIFKKNHINCNLFYLKKIIKSAFQQKRKMLKSSLKSLIQKENCQKLIPSEFTTLRPHQLLPYQFIQLTNLLFPLNDYPFDYTKDNKVWRKSKHGD